MMGDSKMKHSILRWALLIGLAMTLPAIMGVSAGCFPT